MRDEAQKKNVCISAAFLRLRGSDTSIFPEPHVEVFTVLGCIELAAIFNNKTRSFYVLYSDKIWPFDQSECTQGPTCIFIVKSINKLS